MGAAAYAGAALPASRALTASRGHDDSASADLWARVGALSAKRRAVGAARAALVREVRALVGAGDPLADALDAVARQHGAKAATLRKWYHRALRHQPQDWAAVLAPVPPGPTPGVVRKADIPPQAWDFFLGLYLTRKAPTVTEVYRRTLEAARAHGWGALPTCATFNRRVHEIPTHTRAYHRHGAESLARHIPRQRRDTTVYAPGQAVNGDGLKFDRLWVRFPDGEVINTATGWFWQDLRTGRILAYRLGKTESTDLFRLATYDLTATTLPEVVWLDNTTVAANLAMTGQARGRHRFAHQRRAHDALGLLGQLDIEVHFTDPSKEFASPGSKRIERAFGRGGLHHEVANHPRFVDRGHSKATAIPFAELQEVVAEEVRRFNARPGRRAPECAGVKSYDDLWAELLPATVLRVASEAQRKQLLLMVEKARAHADTGEIKLKAGSSHLGAARYWSPWMPEIRGREVAVYYDPEDLRAPVTIAALDGVLLGTADRLADAGHNDTAAAAETRRVRQRQQKAWKKAAADDKRLDAIRAAELYPEPAEAPEIPPPAVITGRFGRSVAADILGARPEADPAAAGTVHFLPVPGARPAEPTDDDEARFAERMRALAEARLRDAL